MNELQIPEYAAVRHILDSPTVGARSAAYIDNDGFDWPGLLAESETMSGGAQVLIRIAYDLWEAEGVVGVWELPRRLDRANFERVLEALALCRGEVSAVGREALARAA
jgi:hypothetical protein